MNLYLLINTMDEKKKFIDFPNFNIMKNCFRFVSPHSTEETSKIKAE